MAKKKTPRVLTMWSCLSSQKKDETRFAKTDSSQPSWNCSQSLWTELTLGIRHYIVTPCKRWCLLVPLSQCCFPISALVLVLCSISAGHSPRSPPHGLHQIETSVSAEPSLLSQPLSLRSRDPYSSCKYPSCKAVLPHVYSYDFST